MREGHHENPFIRAHTKSPSLKEDGGRGEGDGEEAEEGVRDGMAKDDSLLVWYFYEKDDLSAVGRGMV